MDFRLDRRPGHTECEGAAGSHNRRCYRCRLRRNTFDGEIAPGHGWQRCASRRVDFTPYPGNDVHLAGAIEAKSEWERFPLHQIIMQPEQREVAVSRLEGDRRACGNEKSTGRGIVRGCPSTSRVRWMPTHGAIGVLALTKRSSSSLSLWIDGEIGTPALLCQLH